MVGFEKRPRDAGVILDMLRCRCDNGDRDRIMCKKTGCALGQVLRRTPSGYISASGRKRRGSLMCLSASQDVSNGERAELGQTTVSDAVRSEIQFRREASNRAAPGWTPLPDLNQAPQNVTDLRKAIR